MCIWIAFITTENEVSEVQILKASLNITSFGIYFQSIDGMRTDSQSLNLAASQCDCDKLYEDFRKDRGALKSKCAVGEGVLVAVRRHLRCTSAG